MIITSSQDERKEKNIGWTLEFFFIHSVAWSLWFLITTNRLFVPAIAALNDGNHFDIHKYKKHSSNKIYTMVFTSVAQFLALLYFSLSLFESETVRQVLNTFWWLNDAHEMQFINVPCNARFEHDAPQWFYSMSMRTKKWNLKWFCFSCCAKTAQRKR